MPSIASLSTSFTYVDADIPYGQTIAEWQRERALARRAARRARLRFPNILPNLRLAAAA